MPSGERTELGLGYRTSISEFILLTHLATLGRGDYLLISRRNSPRGEGLCQQDPWPLGWKSPL
jgi:hypothetical protein